MSPDEIRAWLVQAQASLAGITGDLREANTRVAILNARYTDLWQQINAAEQRLKQES